MSSTIFFFLFIPLLAFILLAINLIFAPHNPYMEKNSAFECGFSSFLGQNRTQFSISFFIFALLFLLFDLEILLVYPYLVSAYTNGIYGLTILLLFLLALTLGFAFELGKKALSIDSRQMSNKSNVKANCISKVNGNVNFLPFIQKRHYTALNSHVGSNKCLDLSLKAHNTESYFQFYYGLIMSTYNFIKALKFIFKFSFTKNTLLSYIYDKMTFIFISSLSELPFYVIFKEACYQIYKESGFISLLHALSFWISELYVNFMSNKKNIVFLLLLYVFCVYGASNISFILFFNFLLIITAVLSFLSFITLLMSKKFKSKHPLLYLVFMSICVTLFLSISVLIICLYYNVISYSTLLSFISHILNTGRSSSNFSGNNSTSSDGGASAGNGGPPGGGDGGSIVYPPESSNRNKQDKGKYTSNKSDSPTFTHQEIISLREIGWNLEEQKKRHLIENNLNWCGVSHNDNAKQLLYKDMWLTNKQRRLIEKFTHTEAGSHWRNKKDFYISPAFMDALQKYEEH